MVQSFCCCLLRLTPSWQVDISICLPFCHWLFMYGSSSYNSGNTCNLLARFSLYTSLVCGSFRRSTLYICLFVAVTMEFVSTLMSVWQSTVGGQTPRPLPSSLSHRHVISYISFIWKCDLSGSLSSDQVTPIWSCGSFGV